MSIVKNILFSYLKELFWKQFLYPLCDVSVYLTYTFIFICIEQGQDLFHIQGFQIVYFLL